MGLSRLEGSQISLETNDSCLRILVFKRT